MKSKISLQIIVAVSAVSLVAFGSSSVVLIRSQNRTLIGQIEQQAHQLSETIKGSTRYAMLINRPEHVHRIIDTVGRQEGIQKVRIFNKEGRIIYSPDKAQVGEMVDKRAEACFACHAEDLPLERLPTEQRTRIFQVPEQARSLGIINPIYNEPACSEADCHAHPASQSVLGILDLTMSLEEVDRRLTANETQAVLLLLGAILAISLIISIFFQHLVGRPVAELLQATESVAAGDLSHQVEVNRDNELGQLERSFNAMTRQLAETQTQLYQSNKLASLGRLAAGVAHEINNPLTGVLTYGSFLLKRAAEGSEERDDLETIVRETKRCREIVQGLLDFSRQVPPSKVEISLNEIVGRALSIVDNQLRVHNVRVTTTLHEDLPALRADPNQLQQVLINLLVNAADAIGERGGEIFVSTDLKQMEGGSEVVLKIADSGCGIPEEHLDKIFEPFFTTKGREGTGLGLAVVWGIVEEHGGRIQVESRSQRGTTFTIHLPVAVAPALIVAEPRHAKSA